jgi:hypothetical protein
MQGPYLLDTSVFIKLPGTALSGRDFYASPYCFWESLTHLDEEPFDHLDEELFARRKGQLMKFKYVRILNDPRAEIEIPLLIEDRELQNRVSDEEVIEATLAALQASSTIEAFYSSYIQDSKGNVRQVSDCAANAGKILDEAEHRYIEFIKNIVNVFRSGQLNVQTDFDRHQAILQLLEGEVIKLRACGALDTRLREKLITDTYIYYSYVLHQALIYFKNGKKNFEKKKNDYEDGQICLHLKLDTPYCLVTADTELSQAVCETIALLGRLNNSQLRTTVRVANVAGFLNV